MNLVDVYSSPFAVKVLYHLLQERPQEACISHKKMPPYDNHEAFVSSRPYEAWYLIVEDKPVGAIYLTHYNEIGIGILRDAQRLGYASGAIKLLIEKHPRERYLANINPSNEGSIAMFEQLGFGHLQNVYALDA